MKKKIDELINMNFGRDNLKKRETLWHRKKNSPNMSMNGGVSVITKVYKLKMTFPSKENNLSTDITLNQLYSSTSVIILLFFEENDYHIVQ